MVYFHSRKKTLRLITPSPKSTLTLPEFNYTHHECLQQQQKIYRTFPHRLMRRLSRNKMDYFWLILYLILYYGLNLSPIFISRLDLNSISATRSNPRARKKHTSIPLQSNYRHPPPSLSAVLLVSGFFGCCYARFCARKHAVQSAFSSSERALDRASQSRFWL